MRTLLEYALANAAAATALALVALTVGLVVRRPAVRNALWLLVLVRLVLPPVWTVPLPIPAGGEAVEEVVSAVADPAPADVEDWPLAFDPAAEEATASAVVVEPVAEPAAADAPAPFPVYPLLVGAWAAGCAVVFARSAGRVARFRRALRDAYPAPASVQQQAGELAGALGLRRCPPVWVVPGRVSPALWMPGLLPRQARVLLPAGLVAVLDPGQRAAVLAHELAHLRRGDPWVRWLEVLVCGLYWWFPLVFWFRRHLRASEEACCDLWVVAALGGRRAYATALVETAAYLDGPDPVSSPALASGAGPVLNLERRVTMIMQATWPARLTRLGLAGVLGLGVAGLSFGPALAQPPDRPKDGDRKERPKEGDRPRGDGDRPKDGDRPRDGDRRPDAPREKGSDADIQKAREAYEKARKEAREAQQRMMEAEERLAKAEGREPRKFPGGVAGPGAAGGPFLGGGGFGQGFPGGAGGFGGGGGFGGAGRGPQPKDGDRRPDVERPRDGDRRPDPRPDGRPGVEGRGQGGEFRDLQQQIEELRKALEQMRQEMRRGPDRRGDGPAKEGPRERKQ